MNLPSSKSLVDKTTYLQSATMYAFQFTFPTNLVISFIISCLQGKLLGFGSNYFGQLGTGSRQNESSPVTICEDKRIKDVLSSPFCNTSLARTKKKRDSLIFGKCGDHWLLSPVDNPDPQAHKNNNSEAFLTVNHSTAKSAVVKSRKNRWWYILYFLKKKLL